MTTPKSPTLEALAVKGAIETMRDHFAALGRVGGLKGGVVRAQRLSDERRKEIARMGGIARREKLKSQA